MCFGHALFYDTMTYMTGRTHDLAAFTALNIALITIPNTPTISFATAVAALGANMLGGLLPDIDNATSDIWDKFRGGNFLAKLVRPLIGGHRMISHSILGIAIAGWGLKMLLPIIGQVLIVDMNVVWWSIMIGVFSHLVTDSMTKDGVPWLFPIPIRFGIPPLEFMRIKTGGLVEKSIIFPGLITLNTYLIYANYEVFRALARGFF